MEGGDGDGEECGGLGDGGEGGVDGGSDDNKLVLVMIMVGMTWLLCWCWWCVIAEFFLLVDAHCLQTLGQTGGNCILLASPAWVVRAPPHPTVSMSMEGRSGGRLALRNKQWSGHGGGP